MMADDRDQLLQTLFTEAARDLDDGAFTTRAVKQTRGLQYRIITGGIGVALALIACAWIFTAPFQAFALHITQGLATPLIDLGEIRLAWIFSPVNNIASLLVLMAKIMRMLWKKAVSVSYV
jgi:hypothetical protein